MSQPFNGQTAGFIAKVIESLPRNLSAHEMQTMRENPKLLQRRLELALCSQQHLVWATLAIAPSSGEELKQSVLGSHFVFKESMKDMIAKATPTSSHTSKSVELVLWSAEELGIDSKSKWSLADVRRRMQLLDLSFCSFELALEVSLNLSMIGGPKFIPFTTDHDSCGGVLDISNDFYGDNEKPTPMLDCYRSVDYWEKISFNAEYPMVLVRTLSSLDAAELKSVFSETLCSSFGATPALRTRILSAFGSDQLLTLPDLMRYTEGMILRMPNLGKSGLELIKKVLGHYGLTLPARPL